jgi:hypothetical protein
MAMNIDRASLIDGPNNIQIDAKPWQVARLDHGFCNGFVSSGHDETPAKATTSYLSRPRCRSMAGLLKAAAFAEMQF